MAKIPETIKRLADDIRTKIYGAEVRESLAEGIEKSAEISEESNERSKTTEVRQAQLETKYDEQIANMTNENPSISELVDFRTSSVTGQTYQTAGKRADAVDAQLADKANQTDVSTLQTKGSKKKFVLYVSSSKIYVGMRLNSTQDIRFEFTNLNVNGTWQFTRIYLFSNTDKYPSNDFTSIGTPKLSGGTDFISPFVVKAVANATGDWVDKDTSFRFTGGFHDYNGGIGALSPNTVLATAKNYILDIFYDNIKTTVTTAGSYYADDVYIKAQQRVQAYNTMLSTGGGREVLNLDVEYRFKEPLVMDVDMFIEAREDIDINIWYGFIMAMDGAHGAAAQCRMSGTDGNTKVVTINSASGTITNVKVNRLEFMAHDRTFKMIQEINNNFGLGGYYAKDADQPYISWASTNKIYPCPIKKSTGTYLRIPWASGANYNCKIKVLPF